MSYGLFNESGCVGDVATMSEWKSFAIWAAGIGGAVARFARTGSTDSPAELAAQLENVSTLGDNEMVRRDLLEGAKQSEKVLILSSGGDYDAQG